MPTTAELIAQRVGVQTYTRFNPVTDSVDVVPTRVVLANPNRVALTIVNLSTSNIYIAWNNQVSATRGILLDALGGSLALYWTDDLELVTQEVWGISPTGLASIYVVETLIRS